MTPEQLDKERKDFEAWFAKSAKAPVDPWHKEFAWSVWQARAQAPTEQENRLRELVDDLDEAGFIAAEAKFNERSDSPLTPFGSYLLGDSIRAYLNATHKACAPSRQIPETEKAWRKKQWQLIEALYQHSRTMPVEQALNGGDK